MNTTLLTLNQLTFGFTSKPLLHDVSFSLSAGEVLQVVGDNGVGKTTLLNVTAGLILPEKGNIVWKESVTWCYLSEPVGFKSSLTVTENLQLLLAIRGVTLFAEQINTLLETVRLLDLSAHCFNQLSSGQKKRLGLALLLGSKSKVWVLDEPMTALDQAGRTFLQQLMVNHVQTGGAVLLTSHDKLSLKGIEVKMVQLS